MREIAKHIFCVLKNNNADLSYLLHYEYPQLKDLALVCGEEVTSPLEKASIALVYLCVDDQGYNGFSLAVRGIMAYLETYRFNFDYETLYPNLMSAFIENSDPKEVELLLNKNSQK